jgi:2-oxoglutarate ferredoxin oxidoreductase subunit gamma
MHHEIVISGFGGQGVLFAGQLLAYAALEEGRYVTWIPSYGPEMRGGTANCTVIVSDEEIGSPLVRQPTAAVVLNPPSFTRYEPLVKPGGVLLCDATLIQARSARGDIQALAVPAKEIADELDLPQIANVVMLGALAAATQVVQLETLDRVLAQHLSARHRDKLEANKQALRRGAACVTVPAVAASH